MKKILLIIISLAAFSRFLYLGALPAALNRDEAAIGYNAYSLLQTGKDEHGVSWPLNFKSIGDYKMPGYIYATILPVKLFGLNDFSIRFWSAFSGVVSVIMVYLICKLLYTNYLLPITASFLLAFNPWAIFYSRIAFEANLALALFLVGLWLVLIKRYWGLIFWLLAMFTYSSAIIFIPLFFLVFVRNLNKLAVTLFVAGALLSVTLLNPVSAQKSSITVFSDPATIDYYNQARTAVYQENPVLARTWWNKYVYFGRVVGANYWKTFSPRFLLIEGGGHPWQRIPNMGYFYVAEILLAIAGLVNLFKTKHSWRWWLLAWLLLAPLASAITIDAPHATRSLFLLPAIVILASFGIPAKKFIRLGLVGLYLINLSYFSYQYLVNYPKKVAETLPVGLKESLQFVRTKNITGKIYLIGIADSGYLYPTVYSRFDPVKFQTEAVWTGADTVGLVNAYQFGQFRVVDDLIDIDNPAALILTLSIKYYKDPSFESGSYRVYLY